MARKLTPKRGEQTRFLIETRTLAKGNKEELVTIELHRQKGGEYKVDSMSVNEKTKR